MSRKKHLIISTLIFSLTIAGSIAWFMNPPIITRGETVSEEQSEVHLQQIAPHIQGKHVIIYLDTMTLELRDGDTIVATLPLLSQGRPGSYYETIGGTYTNDYKTPLHFSSIGHVYMPHSVHLFGNYFIHGVPYYPDGREVSSAYSGGCIRLANDNAKLVYNFIDKGTPITVTRDGEHGFDPTQAASSTLSSLEMTNLMVASISLELLTQDNPITNTNGTITTRKALLPRLINDGDVSVAHLYAKSIGEQAFINAMNEKAIALGLTNTRFVSLEIPVDTTYDDYARFMTYITTYKSYIRGVQGKSGSR